MLHDFRFAVRLFLRQRGFFTTAVLTIALGVGLSATVFAVVDGVLFRPLPYREPDRLIGMYGAARAEHQFTMPISVPDLVDWRAASRSFEQIEAYDLDRPQARIRGVEESVQTPCSAVTAGFIDMLGVRAATGRTSAADDFNAGAPPVAIISDRLWRGAFGGGTDVLGRTAGDAAAITMLSTVEDLYAVSVAERNFNTLLFGAFGIAGVAVAVVGIYGLVAFVVARREREMGTRLALGANGRGLKIFIMSGTLRWVGAGLAAGIGASLLLAQYLKPFVYQVSPNDPVTLTLVAVLFLLVAAVATYVPARRAAPVDPMIALRAE